MLRSTRNETFANGVTTYEYRAPSPSSKIDRIFIPVEIEGVMTTAVLDTGGIYFCLDPSFALALGIEPWQGFEKHKLGIRDTTFSGVLHRLSLKFIASEGQSSVIEATAFIPNGEHQEEWQRMDLPNFLGFQGCMDRVRFAIDPEKVLFYFGTGAS
jgi:hypothetical protein